MDHWVLSIDIYMCLQARVWWFGIDNSFIVLIVLIVYHIILFLYFIIYRSTLGYVYIKYNIFILEYSLNQ